MKFMSKFYVSKFIDILEIESKEIRGNFIEQ